MKTRWGLAAMTGVLATTITLLPTPARASTIYNVTIDTSALAGMEGQLVFDFLVNAPPSSNHVEILNFTAPGSVAGLPTTQGGLVVGDLILPPFNQGAFTEIEGGSFFNELVVNFTSFGNGIAFTLEMPEFGPLAGRLPDQFSLFLLNTAGVPLFLTSDPTGANALFALDITGQSGGRLSAFDPTTVTGQNLNIVVPGGQVVPEPATSTLVGLGILGLAALRRRLSRGRV